jgi:adenylate kinase family enzyme
MKRIVIFGPGGSGKSTLARHLAEITKLPHIELDKVYWQQGVAPRSPEQWAALQRELAAKDAWIMDGDLGPYDIVDIRLRKADTVIVLDFSILRCAWRALRRSRERADFWWWLLTYRWQSRPLLMRAIREHTADADIHVLHNPRTLRRFVEKLPRVLA